MSTKIAFLDMNFWFAKGCQQYPETLHIMENTSAGVSGHNLWDEYEEIQFLPNIFSPTSLFKLLYSDNTLIGSDIHHKFKKIESSEFAYLSTRLKNLFDTFRYNQSLCVMYADPNLLSESILVDVDIEYPFLEILRVSKKFTYQLDNEVTELPISESDFLSSYMSQFDTSTPLVKVILIELFYLHYNLEDSFIKYNMLSSIIDELIVNETNKSYALMTILYAYLLMNKLLQKKVLSKTSIVYTPDYWSNDQ